MKIFLVLLLVYPFWGVPLHLVCNFFLSSALARKHSAMHAWSIAMAINIGVFTPLVLTSSGLFGNTYIPWYLAAMLTPPSPDFSFRGLLIVALISAASSALWIKVARRRRPRPRP